MRCQYEETSHYGMDPNECNVNYYRMIFEMHNNVIWALQQKNVQSSLVIGAFYEYTGILFHRILYIKYSTECSK
jgi:hypothetical protein